MSYFFIINSRIGKRRIQSVREEILHVFANEIIEIHCTEYGGHAKELAETAIRKQVSTIVAIGGDGTVNEILQVIVGTHCRLGIVPMGSGNGLARHCNIPLKPLQALQVVKDGFFVKVDIGLINQVYFISNTGVAFDAWVCQQIKKTTSRGLKMYIQFVIKNFFSYKRSEYLIKTEDQTLNTKAYFLNAANGKQFGYGFELASNASLTDGLLDIIIVKNINFWRGLVFVWKGWRGKLKADDNVLIIKAKSIQIQSKNMKFFQTDGDAHPTDGKCDIRVVPSCLNLIIQANSKNAI